MFLQASNLNLLKPRIDCRPSSHLLAAARPSAILSALRASPVPKSLAGDRFCPPGFGTQRTHRRRDLRKKLLKKAIRCLAPRVAVLNDKVFTPAIETRIVDRDYWSLLLASMEHASFSAEFAAAIDDYWSLLLASLEHASFSSEFVAAIEEAPVHVRSTVSPSLLVEAEIALPTSIDSAVNIVASVTEDIATNLGSVLHDLSDEQRCNAELVQFHGHGPALVSEIPCGQPVLLIGLKAEHMNGTVGALGPWDQKSKRFQVLMPDSSIKMIKPCNLTDPDDSDAD